MNQEERIKELEKYIEFLNEISSRFEDAEKSFDHLILPGYTTSALEIASAAIYLATDLATYSLQDLKGKT